ncbi:hypothetical protein VNO77_41733 [Canavalia gladiata]|uniref:Gnk2-homologous domain-containing protein n=1 Tax=Canavalia gladiata TaxID=3824 RepID=A0AAN9PRT2_CANGL
MATRKQRIIFSGLCGSLNLATHAEAAPTYTATYCTNSTTYAPNTTFHTNLKILFYYLSNNISHSNGYFFTIEGFGTTDAVSGLFLCRADISTTLCQQCVSAATAEIRRRCPNQTEAAIWYDECMLRYANRYVTINSVSPMVNLKDANNISGVDLGRFNQSLYGLLNDLATKAASSQSRKFAAGEVEVTRSVTMYGLEQCTDDLTDAACEACLRYAIGTLPSCCTEKQGARALLPSCNVRYELYPFYTVTSPSGEGKAGWATVVLIVGVPIVLQILCMVGMYWCGGRK